MNIFERIKARVKLNDLYATARMALAPEEFEKFKANHERMYQLVKKKKRSMADAFEMLVLHVETLKIIENASEEASKCQK